MSWFTEVVQHLRTLLLLLTTQDWFIAYTKQMTPGDWVCSSNFHGLCLYEVHIHTCRKHTHTHKMKINKPMLERWLISECMHLLQTWFRFLAPTSKTWGQIHTPSCPATGYSFYLFVYVLNFFTYNKNLKNRSCVSFCTSIL